jgi:hypothetical protein
MGTEQEAKVAPHREHPKGVFMAAHHDHGHTPAAWTGAIISFVGFLAAGVFIVAAEPVPFWISMGVVLLGPLVGGIMKTMGLGSKHAPFLLVGQDGEALSETAEQQEQAAVHA